LSVTYLYFDRYNGHRFIDGLLNIQMDQNECKKDILTRCTENGGFLNIISMKVTIHNFEVKKIVFWVLLQSFI
ncbi:TPA: hypothetical protein ACSZIN_15945, partial [Listeria monocytogenes]